MAGKLMKPAEHAEKQLIEAILTSEYCPGDSLPAERILAEKLGVTRPTLRETLQRLSKEGWFTIKHGKPTRVNDYLNHGGLGILNSITKYGDTLSSDMVSYLLEARAVMFPEIATKAVAKSFLKIKACLEKANTLEDISDVYASYDWELQMLMVKEAENPVFSMIFHDFTPLYTFLGKIYFDFPESRSTSLLYYKELLDALEQGSSDIKPIIGKAMALSQKLWQEIV